MCLYINFKHMKYLISILFVCSLFGFKNFFYDEEDWFIIKRPGSINSITDNSFSVYFGTDNGIFEYDKMYEELKYNHIMTSGLPNDKISHIFYDTYSDHFWIAHSDGISYKSSISINYRDITWGDLGRNGINFIDDIGSTSSHIWIRSGNLFVSFNPFNGKPDATYYDDFYDKDMIEWGSSVYGIKGENIDISQYYIHSKKNWMIGYNVTSHNGVVVDRGIFIDEMGRHINPTVFHKDRDHNIWFGTDRGVLLHGSEYSYRLNIADIGLYSDIISNAYVDSSSVWWFFDSQYNRKGEQKDDPYRKFEGDDIFLTMWDEKNNSWRNFDISESTTIKSGDLNDVLRVEENIFMATMYGVVIYNTISDSWDIIDVNDGLNSNSIWDLILYQDVIFILTSEGINELDINQLLVIPDPNGIYQKLENKKIYDMCKVDNNFLISTNSGIFKLDYHEKRISFLQPYLCYQIEGDEEEQFCLNNQIWSLDLLDNENPEDPDVIHDEFSRNFSISDGYMWINQTNDVKLLEIDTKKSWIYSIEDGLPGNNIFHVDCDDEWAWFITNDGIALYNWRKYHD